MGLLLAGVGVVPVAFLGALFKGEPGLAFLGVLLPAALTYAVRALALRWSDERRPSCL